MEGREHQISNTKNRGRKRIRKRIQQAKLVGHACAAPKNTKRPVCALDIRYSGGRVRTVHHAFDSAKCELRVGRRTWYAARVRELDGDSSRGVDRVVLELGDPLQHLLFLERVSHVGLDVADDPGHLSLEELGVHDG